MSSGAPPSSIFPSLWLQLCITMLHFLRGCPGSRVGSLCLCIKPFIPLRCFPIPQGHVFYSQPCVIPQRLVFYPFLQTDIKLALDSVSFVFLSVPTQLPRTLYMHLLNFLLNGMYNDLFQIKCSINKIILASSKGELPISGWANKKRMWACVFRMNLKQLANQNFQNWIEEH